MTSEQDRFFLSHAIELARGGMGKNFPNPLVGAVVVQDGRIVGEGFYSGPGSRHAEVVALSRAGEKARGGTIYLNLEPCCHHGMTPPCTDAIVSSGVSRVVFSHYDPDERVRGGGARILTENGIEVEVGGMVEEAIELNLPYIHNRLSSKPFVVLKLASTLDGRITLGNKKYITGDSSRRYIHELRAWLESIAVGINTFLSDNPNLDRRLFPVQLPAPVRVVFDYYCRFPEESRWLMDGERVIVFCHNGSDKKRMEKLKGKGAEIIEVSGQDGLLNLDECLDELSKLGITSILVEGGARIATSIIEKRLFDRLVIVYAPYFGGESEVALFGSRDTPGWQGGEGIVLKEVRRFGNDMVAIYDREEVSRYKDLLLSNVVE